ncbi:hypothetical protein BUALT_Bualt07G0024400 [Buddleja alternifolia]|uniref:NB-ARC domain-containing protein n=1 Tax=Buddleja alternifolia TaxID=168488 RepID=A0AAV6XI81_9LAMI|nr:hypothetical protein BUALT_Bualt07G0024400 [Buddleja alternifolia]
MVGFDEHFVLIMDQLTGHQPNPHIIPIVGIGGTGKTTLARNAFENKCVVEHFDVLLCRLREWKSSNGYHGTTRLLDMADALGSRSPYLMNFLDEDKSWNLFCEKAFPQQNYSPELEEPGKIIAKSCRGLPLEIVVVGGCFAKSSKTREYWQFVAENLYVNSDNDERCLKILALSYHHLPIHLKPYFLYMRVFPEDCEVQVS